MLVLLAGGGAHGYAITAQLEEMEYHARAPWTSARSFRTLRDLEAAGQVTSSWSAELLGPQRRGYELTEAGFAAIDAWAAVMKERARLDRRVQRAIPRVGGCATPTTLTSFAPRTGQGQ